MEISSLSNLQTTVLVQVCFHLSIMDRADNQSARVSTHLPTRLSQVYPKAYQVKSLKWELAHSIVLTISRQHLQCSSMSKVFRRQVLIKLSLQHQRTTLQLLKSSAKFQPPTRLKKRTTSLTLTEIEINHLI